jgi:hypothetical protein
MNVIAFSMIKNEEDIVEQFIRHNLNYCDVIYIYDHFSTDHTRRIVEACQSEGLKVFLTNDVIDQYISPTIAHIQGEIMNVMLRLLHAQLGFGVYLPLDADEFIVHEEGPICFRAAMQELPTNSWSEIPWRCLIAANDQTLETSDPIASCRLAQKRSLMLAAGHTCKSIIKINGQTELQNVLLTYGNHQVLDNEGSLRKVECPMVYYLHAPIRSPGQIARKTVLGWLTNVIRRGKVGDSAVHWGELFNAMIERNSLEFRNVAEIYKYKAYAPFDLALSENVEDVQIDLLLNYELRYSYLRHGDVGVILRDLEEMMHKLHNFVK